MLKSIAIGTCDFKKLIESNSYYVDKTDIIEELIEKKYIYFLDLEDLVKVYLYQC